MKRFREPYIESGWDDYRKMVVPTEAPDFQVAETRQAFYSGACVTWRGLVMSFKPGLEAEPEDIQLWKDINEELIEFGMSAGSDGTGDYAVREKGFVANGWRGYRQLCLPPEILSVREDSNCSAYYAGAFYIVRALASLTENVNEERATATFDAIEKETREFEVKLDTAFGYGAN